MGAPVVKGTAVFTIVTTDYVWMRIRDITREETENLAKIFTIFDVTFEEDA